MLEAVFARRQGGGGGDLGCYEDGEEMTRWCKWI